MRRLCAILVLLPAVVLLPSPAMAACSAIAYPVFHGWDGFFEDCPDDHPVMAFAYLISDPLAANSNGQDLVCESRGPAVTDAGGPCQIAAGEIGDGIVTLQYDWGISNMGSLGCPRDPLLAKEGRIAINVVANDGSAAIISVGYHVWLAGYLAEAAHPYEEPVLGSNLPLSCADPDSRSLRLVDASTLGSVMIADVEVLVPRIYSDCDPGSAGAINATILENSCPGGPSSSPELSLGQVYWTSGPCPQFGGIDDIRTSEWNFAATPDETGAATVLFPEPEGTSCAYIGATYRIGEHESPAISGFVAIPGPQVVERIVLGLTDPPQGGLGLVSWSTNREVDVEGFNVVVETGPHRMQLNDGIIPCEECQSGFGHDYSFVLPIHGIGRNVYVEMIRLDGRVDHFGPAQRMPIGL